MTPFFLIKKYFEGTEKYSLFRLILEFGLISIFSKFIVGLIIVISIGTFYILPKVLLDPNFNLEAFSLPEHKQTAVENVKNEGIIALITAFFVVFVTPPIETLIFQILPIWVVSFFSKRRLYMVIISTLFFTLPHGYEYPIIALFIFPSGVFLAWSYIITAKKSKLKAFFVTSSIHLIFNLFMVTIAFIASK